jgi:hypothetical protein
MLWISTIPGKSAANAVEWLPLYRRCPCDILACYLRYKGNVVRIAKGWGSAGGFTFLEDLS